MNSVRKTVCAAGFALAIALGVVAPVAAAQPLHVTFQIDETFQSGLWTTRCRIPVFVHLVVGGSAIVFYGSDGTTIDKEVDTSTAFQRTYSSPLEAGGTGISFTERGGGILKTYYPEGVYPGAPALLEILGVQGFPSPGNTAAGRIVADGEVIFMTPEGVPGVDVLAVVSQDGHFYTTPEVIALRCAYLTGA